VSVLDASAVLAFLQGEDGSDLVEQALIDGARCSAANWSEVAQEVLSSGHNWELAATLLATYGLGVEPVTREDGDLAARLWRPGSALSLGDRLCLALGARLGRPVLTADRQWAALGDVTGPAIEVVIIR
jgi:PIN domain nuclease of toxin-antitoxin system